MTKPQCLISRRSPDDRRQLLQNHHPTRRTHRVGEVVGGAMAEVAAVCCCVPCAVVDFMVLTMYKVPAGLCRNAMRKRRRRRLMMRYNGGGRNVDEEFGALTAATVETFMAPAAVDKDVVAFENEMWDKFSETGFWRSPSNVGDIVVSTEVISSVVPITD